MIDIVVTKFKLLVRKPGMILSMTTMTIIMAFVTGFSDASGATEVPVYTTDEGVRDSMVGQMMDESDAYTFKWMNEQQAMKKIKTGETEMGVALGMNDFEIHVGVQSGFVDLVKRSVQQAYLKQAQYTQLMDTAADTGQSVTISDIDDRVAEGPFAVNLQSVQAEHDSPYNQTHHALFGFTLFFVIYTIGSSVFQILAEKQLGVWDRVILSPIKKWQMYTANFVYSYLIGYSQIVLVFGIFKYWVGVDFGGRFVETLFVVSAYVFAIVALCILLTGLVKTGQQFNALLSIAALAIAMIGGMFWPLEAVDSQTMLGLSKLVPTTYGLELIKDVAVFALPLEEVVFPFSMLIFMGVLMTGVGIHLMEKRHV